MGARQAVVLFRLLAAVCVLTATLASGSGTAVAAPVTGMTGPGGVGSTDGTSALRLWVRGDAGVVANGSSQVTQWTDQSGYNNHLLPDSLGQAPTYATAGPSLQNGVPTVIFAGPSTPQFLRRSSLALTDPSATATSIAAYQMDNAVAGTDVGLPWFARSPGNLGLHSNGGNPYSTNMYPSGGSATVNGLGTTLSKGTFGIVRGASAGINTGTPYNATFGADVCCTGVNGRVLQGRIGELAVFNRGLNTAEQRIVDNYLAAKFGVTLNAGDVYAGDTLHGYTRDVFGVGRGTGAGHTLLNTGAAGFGIEVNPASLDADNEFIMAGHNQAINSLTTADVPSPGMERFSRDWYVDVTGGVDGDFGFDFSDAGLGAPDPSDNFFLLYRNAPSGDFAILSTGLLSGDLVTFNLSNILDGFYTLGIQPPPLAPEPASWALLSVALAGLIGWRWRRGR